jgi:hypothetical protein
MAKIVTLLKRLLKDMEWPYRRAGDDTLTATAVSSHGRWPWSARWTDDESVVVCYGTLPVPVPPERRAAMAELLCRVNYGLGAGCFELDLDDGECRCRTSFVFRGVQPNKESIEMTCVTGLMLMDTYIGVLLAVACGGLSPEDAMAQHQASQEQDEV